MDGILNRIRDTITDDRFAANLIAAYGLIVAAVVVYLFARRLLAHGESRLKDLAEGHWLSGFGHEAVQRTRVVLFWLLQAVMFVTLTSSLAYHFVGRDVRADLGGWYRHLTPDEVFRLGLAAAGVAGVLVAARVAVTLIRRALAYLEGRSARLLQGKGNAETIRHWFLLLRRFALAAVGLAAAWACGQLVGLGEAASAAVGFVLRVLTILVAARLLTLACRTLSNAAREAGDRYLGRGKLGRYWERVTRLFPFGERCFEAAVYVTAASLGVRELSFVAGAAEYGPKVVQCIGIFFLTRVAIELLQVLLNEAFGLYAEDRPADQKGQTLVPLLHSLGQYVLYFGSAMLMLGTLDVDTKPFLAGAGILGLGVGLGAQSLVTDVVSGFFILFENQYLVGDYVQVGDATGVVEAVSIRHTQIRDGQGKLHIIPNGQIKTVVTYSKGYVNAVVDVKMPAGSDLEAVFRAMTEAGRLLRQTRREALADTVIQGLVELGIAELTVRAVTRVQPGTHVAMQNEYRRLLKQVLDKSAAKPALAA